MVADMARQRSSAGGTAELVKPTIDEQQYRLVQLENGLKALLIHDEDTDKASAAMDVSTLKHAGVEAVLSMSNL